MSNKIKLLHYGDSPACTTGFARVSQGVLENLYATNEYDISILGVNQQLGDPHRYEGMFRIYPARSKGNVYGINRVVEVITREKPDIILVNNDLWIINEILKFIPKGNKVITYSPIDALPVQKEWLGTINKVGANMALYTEYAKEAVLKINPEQEISTIGHGVDTDEFYPIEDARTFLSDVPKDAFIIFNGNRNQPRKRIDLFLKACAEFINSNRDKKDIYVYMHTILADLGWNILDLARRWGIEDRILITNQEGLNASNGVPIQTLCKLYNLGNVNVNTSMGEGFGLVSFESAACHVPVIVPNSSACTELWKDKAPLINIDHYDVLTGGINTEGAVISVPHLVEILNDLYYNREKLKKYADLAYEHSQKEEFTWKYVANQFDKLIKKVLSSNKTTEEYK